MAVITISRQYGSRGNEIARLLCEGLGYRYFDKELMAQLGAEIGLTPDTITALPQDKLYHARNHLERLFALIPTPSGDIPGLGQAARATAEEQMERLSLQTVESLIHAAHEQDKVVVVGRAGQVVLRGVPNVFHVRVIGPIEQRIQRIQQSNGLTRDGARQLVQRRDQAARDYVKNFYNVDWNDPLLYDLVINTGNLSSTLVVSLIRTALEGLPAAQLVSPGTAA